VSDPHFSAFQAAISDRWVIEGEIGRGSRAAVFRARDVANGDPVAIKVLHTDLASALDWKRFAQQMKLASQVRHPGIIPSLDVADIAGRLFIVMPYVEGESLRSRLKRERQLALPEALAITRQVADALGHAHRHDVLHKDVKPENIFLSKSRTMVMNLGLSRAISRSMEETVTGTGLSLGTPEYMSPEHAQGGVEIDARADLYSLGCVLYEMLAGEPPFTGAQAPKVWMKTLTETPVPISRVRDGIPTDVETTVDRLLAKAPSARYPDAAHLVDALSTLNA